MTLATIKSSAGPLTNQVEMHEFESTMNRIDGIKEVRWLEGVDRWYRFSIPVRLQESRAIVDRPVTPEANWCRLSPAGRRIVKRLLDRKGIRELEVRQFDIIVKKARNASWDDLHPDIVEIIYGTLFEGMTPLT